MEKTINKIFEIEEKAKIIIERANQEKLRMHDEFEETLAKMEKEISNKNAAKVSEFKSGIEKELENEKKQLIKKSEKQLADMDEQYQKNREELINRIFDSILRS